MQAFVVLMLVLTFDPYYDCPWWRVADTSALTMREPTPIVKATGGSS